MVEQFQEFLKQEGYSEYTPSGNKSTVYDYSKRVNRVREWEDLTWDGLVENIKSMSI